MRTFAQRRGHADLAPYLTLLAGDAGGARRVPRPRDDQRLAPVAQPGAVGRACSRDRCPSSPPRGRCAPGAPAAPTAPRPTRWPRSAARPPRPRARRDPRHRHRPPHDRARPRRRLQRRGRRDAPPAALARFFEPRDGGGWQRRPPSCARWCSFELGDLLRLRPPRAPTTSSSAATPSSTSPRTSATRSTSGSRPRCDPAAYLVVGATERVDRARGDRARSRRPLHLPQGLSDGHLRVPPDVPRRVPRAPAGAQPRRRAHRGAARRPRDGRRDLPHRALAEGHERHHGLRGHGRPDPSDGGRLRAAAPAHAAAWRARRSTSCSSASTRSRPPPTPSRPTAPSAWSPRR